MTLNKSILFGLVASLVLVVVYLVGASATRVEATAGFLPATVATTSIATVSTTQSLVMATSSCNTRIISTTGLSGINIGFSDNQGFTPSATQGFWQPASTTVAYDSGLYGCGAVRVYSGVSQVITVSDVR